MSKILRITLEFDKEIRTLEGEEAEKWQEATTSQGVFCFTHGMEFPQLKWKVTKKDD
jgi:hypothetical protein